MDHSTLLLREGEKLLLSGAANKWQAVGNKGGTLFLTNQRIVFQAHVINFGSKHDEYELTDIRTNGSTVDFKISSMLVSYNMTFYTKSGEELSFVVTKKQKDEWVRQITNAVMAVQTNAK